MRPPRPHFIFACTAVIFAILWNGNVVSQDVQPDPKDAVDFILLIDLGVPYISGYYPTELIFIGNSRTVHWWTLRLLMNLMKQGYSKRVDTRVIVFLRDDNSLEKVGEYYSRHHSSNQYVLPGLDSHAAKMASQPESDRLQLIRKKIANASAAGRPANRTGVPEIVVWHVPYGGNKTSDVIYWRMKHYPPADVMVTMDRYVHKPYRQNKHVPMGVHMIVSHVLVKKAYQISWYVPFDPSPGDAYRPSEQDPFIEELWKHFYSCRGEVKSMPCRFVKSDACVFKVSYTPPASVETNLQKFCRNGTVVLDCPLGREQCELLCADATKEGPCSATCGDGKKVKGPRDPENELTKHCQSVILDCYGPPCDQPLETTKRKTPRTWMTHSVTSAKTSTTETVAVEGIVLESWMIAVIAVGATAVLATIICITALCLCQRKRKRALLNQHRAPAHHRYGQTGGSHTRTGHGGRSRRAPSPSHPRNVQPPSRPRYKSPSHQRTKSPSPSSPNLPAHSHIRREGAVGTVSASLLKSPSPHRTQSPSRLRTKHGQSSPKAYRPASTHIHREVDTGTVSASLLTAD